jgi:hypothetical protein
MCQAFAKKNTSRQGRVIVIASVKVLSAIPAIVRSQTSPSGSGTRIPGTTAGWKQVTIGRHGSSAIGRRLWAALDSCRATSRRVAAGTRSPSFADRRIHANAWNRQAEKNRETGFSGSPPVDRWIPFRSVAVVGHASSSSLLRYVSSSADGWHSTADRATASDGFELSHSLRGTSSSPKAPNISESGIFKLHSLAEWVAGLVWDRVSLWGLRSTSRRRPGIGG